MGKREGKQQSMWIGTAELPRSSGHRFYEKLNELLREADFDGKVEALCAKSYEADGTGGRRSIAPGVYFRMLFVGYFEGIESERGIEWRCSDSLSLRWFLGLLPEETVPDHSTLSRIRTRLPASVYDDVFRLVLRIVADKGLLRGKVVGVDSTYLRADASMKAIVRRDTGEGYQTFIKGLAVEEGIENPTVEDARRVDRNRKGKRTSNKDWKSKTDADARVARLKDGRTRLGYKAEHVVDMESGVVVAAEIHPADRGDTQTVEATLDEARANIQSAKSADDDDDDPSNGEGRGAGTGSTPQPTIELVGDKGYHKAALLRTLKNKRYRTYISVPNPPRSGSHRWHDKGGYYTARCYYANRDRATSDKGRALMRLRGERIERTFAHACESGGHRRVRLRGRENVAKRYSIHIAALNLGVALRHLFGVGTPKAMGDARKGLAWLTFVVRTLMVALATRIRLPNSLSWCALETLSGSVVPRYDEMYP